MTGILCALAGTPNESSTVISVTNQSVTDISGGLLSASVGYQINADAGVYTKVGIAGSYALVETWCTPTTDASNFEVLATVTTGSLSSGTAGSWLALSSTRSWTRDASAGNSELCVFTVDIRRIGTGTILDSATITLTADALP